jgi:hypothetical protein
VTASATIAAVATGAILLLAAGFWISAERGWLLRRSTRRFFKEAGLGLNALHGYIYGRWTKQNICLLLNAPAAPPPRMLLWLAERYHGKVLTHDRARSIVLLDKDIPLRDLEQIVPFPVARNLVLKGPCCECSRPAC